jgi:long-chain acyl-CoA synthetase
VERNDDELQPRGHLAGVGGRIAGQAGRALRRRAADYAQLDALSDQLAAGLRERGLRPGDAVGLQLPNLPQFLVAYFGILKAGAVAVPMNVLLKAPEVAFYLGDSNARAFITWAVCSPTRRRGRRRRG